MGHFTLRDNIKGRSTRRDNIKGCSTQRENMSFYWTQQHKGPFTQRNSIKGRFAHVKWNKQNYQLSKNFLTFFFDEKSSVHYWKDKLAQDNNKTKARNLTHETR